MRHQTIERMVEQHIPANSYAEQWNVKGLHEEALRIFALDLPTADWAKEEGIAEVEIRERLTAEGSNVEAVNRQRVRAVGKVTGLVDAALQLPIESEGGPIREHRSRQERGALWELTVARPRAAVPIGREEKRFDQTAHRLARVVDHDHVGEVAGVLPVRGIGGGGLHGEYLPLYLRAGRTAHAEQREAGERNRVLPAHDAGSRGCEAPASQGLPL